MLKTKLENHIIGENHPQCTHSMKSITPNIRCAFMVRGIDLQQLSANRSSAGVD